jgi:hypothetical protein
LPVSRGLIVAIGLRGTLDGDADLWLRNPGLDDACACDDAVGVGELG